jgi:cell division protein FtsB
VTFCGYTYEPDDRCECVEERGHAGMHKCLHEQAAEKLNKILANKRVALTKEKTMIERETPVFLRRKGLTLSEAVDHVLSEVRPVELDVSVADVSGLKAALAKQTDINNRQHRAIEALTRRITKLEDESI